MPNKVRRRVYFYEIEAQALDSHSRPHRTSIDAVLQHLRTKRAVPGHPQTCVIDLEGRMMAIRIRGADSELITGQLCSIRDDRTLKVIGDDGTQDVVADMDIPTDKHVIEMSHFVYFVQLGVIGLEFNQRLPRHRIFGDFLMRYAHRHTLPLDEVQLKLIMSNSAQRRLMQLGAITSVNVSILSTQVDQIQSASKLSQMLRAHTEAVPGEYEIVLKVQRVDRKRTSGIPVTKEDVSSLWADAAGILESFIVRAQRTQTRGIEDLNFLRDGMIGDFELTRDGDTVAASEMFAQTKDYFDNSVKDVIESARRI